MGIRLPGKCPVGQTSWHRQKIRSVFGMTRVFASIPIQGVYCTVRSPSLLCHSFSFVYYSFRKNAEVTYCCMHMQMLHRLCPAAWTAVGHGRLVLWTLVWAVGGTAGWLLTLLIYLVSLFYLKWFLVNTDLGLVTYYISMLLPLRAFPECIALTLSTNSCRGLVNALSRLTCKMWLHNC